MSKRAKIFTGIGVVTALMIACKVLLFFYERYYVFSEWFDNVLIFTGLAALFGNLVAFLSGVKDLEEFEKNFFLCGVILTGALAYYASRGYLYLLTVTIVPEKELTKALINVKYSSFPWLYGIIAAAAFVITYLVLKKRPSLIVLDVGEVFSLREEIDADAVKYKEIAIQSKQAENLMSLRQYEYFDIHKDTTQWNFFRLAENRDVEKDKVYVIEYREKPMGYFVERRKDENSYEITELYGSSPIDKSFQALRVALMQYLSTISGAEVRFLDVGCLPNTVMSLIEFIIKEHTDANYELIGTGEKEGRKNYDICLKL